MSDSTYEIIGLTTLCLVAGVFVYMLLALVAFKWMDDKVQRIKRLFKKEKRPARNRNRAVVRRATTRTAKRHTQAA